MSDAYGSAGPYKTVWLVCEDKHRGVLGCGNAADHNDRPETGRIPALGGPAEDATTMPGGSAGPC